ncbi:MAG TPA: prephenate dehydrogenase [Anaerolineae bacterium]|nr:prephenate dehydrogenase [Anaerolineae bacterium]
MSQEKPRVTIIGLGLIGGSIGLALRRAGAASRIVGHDLDREANIQAKKMGAVDRIEWNLPAAAEKADLVILSTPVGGMEETLRVIGPALRPGCVVLDTATVKRPVLAWAAEYLPEGVHFVGGDPILSAASDGRGGLEAARADLFRGGLFCIVPAPGSHESAIRLTGDLVRILGAKPLFLDAAEHDGLIAAVDHLPALLALALTETAVGQPTWRELRKMAGPAFETGSELVAADIVGYGQACFANRDNLLRWLDAFAEALASIRRTLTEGQAEDLTGRFYAAWDERQKWLADRSEGQWLEGPRPELPERPGLLETFLGGLWPKKPPPAE